MMMHLEIKTMAATIGQALTEAIRSKKGIDKGKSRKKEKEAAQRQDKYAKLRANDRLLAEAMERAENG